jgi:hypothetical protein
MIARFMSFYKLGVTVDHQLMPLVVLVESSARLLMLAGDSVWSSAEQPMRSV